MLWLSAAPLTHVQSHPSPISPLLPASEPFSICSRWTYFLAIFGTHQDGSTFKNFALGVLCTEILFYQISTRLTPSFPPSLFSNVTLSVRHSFLTYLKVTQMSPTSPRIYFFSLLHCFSLNLSSPVYRFVCLFVSCLPLLGVKTKQYKTEIRNWVCFVHCSNPNVKTQPVISLALGRYLMSWMVVDYM